MLRLRVTVSDAIVQFTHVELAIVCVSVIGFAVIAALAISGWRHAMEEKP